MHYTFNHFQKISIPQITHELPQKKNFQNQNFLTQQSKNISNSKF